jgi:transposase
VLAKRNDVQLAFCWSHVRRRFYELAAAGPAPIATEALERIAKLYAIEKDIRGRNADERRAVRQERSRPIINELDPWLRAKLALISQKTKLAEAIRYALSRWDGLTRFLDDGRIEIDSNVVERSIRPIALNRKNALFAGSDGGAEHWAVVASLIETCKLNGIDPHAYLADAMANIVSDHVMWKSLWCVWTTVTEVFFSVMKSCASAVNTTSWPNCWALFKIAVRAASVATTA